MEGLSLFLLLLIFIISALVTCLAGVSLTRSTTTLDSRFKLGDAFGGLILLGISGSLPELAIVLSAARAGHTSVIIGTLLGGIAFQTLLIVIFDYASGKKRSIAYLAGSPMLVVETLFAILITGLALLGTLVPSEYSLFNINPFSIITVIAWIFGLFMINNLRRSKRYYQTATEAAPGRYHQERRASDHPAHKNKKTWRVIFIFVLACLATLIAGYFVEEAGSALAWRFGMSSSLFAATFIALVSSLPEISTGLESVFMGDNHLAISDIMGGNAFMLTIFLLADLVAGKPILSFANQTDTLFAVLGIILMAVYAWAFWKKPKRCFLRLGVDSYLEIIIYLAGLFFLLGIVK